MEDTHRPLNITLLAGGISAEREVSLATGRQISEALRSLGHHVHQADISPTNLSALDHKPCDLVFPALHGVFGEDGGVQEILDARGIAYVGSGAAASRLAMDKVEAKRVLLEHQVSTPNWQIVYAHKFKDSWTPASGIGYPCVIKPIAEGSSVGCRVCQDAAEARAHLSETLPRYDAMLVERFVEGPELTVGILDGNALPVIQVRPARGFYDYQAKYLRDDTDYRFDIDLSPTVLQAVRDAALASYRVVGARHLARVDIMVDAATLEPLVLEINTMPGFTTHSLVPKAAAHAGIPFADLCQRLVRLAMRDAGDVPPARTAARRAPLAVA